MKKDIEGRVKVCLGDWKVTNPLAKLKTSWEPCLAPLGFAHSVKVKKLKTWLMAI